MALRAYNGRLELEGGKMSYIRFGSGEKALLLLPGAGDGFKTVEGTALPFALGYRALAKDFTVYAFSRREPLPEGSSTRDMARDLAAAMDALGLERACVLGVSMGGMIAQWLAIDHAEKVERLVLAVSAARPNDTMREALGRWMELAEQGAYKSIMVDTAERSYSARTVKKQRAAYALLGSLTKPRSFQRFLIQCRACLEHDAYALLPRICCPTLVLGGDADRIVSPEGSRELAAQIPGAQLRLYEGLSHAAYEEAEGFLEQVAAFCLAKQC
ncbi:MAG: alpha/beta fold hydrolase [Oscillospiraceae bacterium]|nr:alpha/beta fold hydrolase [Oscillospiraceae bacterium]